eukprot:g1822.t1
MGRGRAVFVAATRQHVGKTSTSLGLVSALLTQFDRVGFIKPVGQQSTDVMEDDGSRARVDKDVPLFKERFGIRDRYTDMSPLVLGRGYTQKFLDGQISYSEQLRMMHGAFGRIQDSNDFTVVEGTGHSAVGSIVGLNNARVAAELQVPVVLICNGGIGSAVDEIELNRQLCHSQGARIAGVILNKVKPDKLESVRHYVAKALQRWYIPLIACIPDYEFLDSPCLGDYERLFGGELIAGDDGHHAHRLQHFEHGIELVSAGLHEFLDKLNEPSADGTLFVTHVSRSDIALAFLSHARNRRGVASSLQDPAGGSNTGTGTGSSRIRSSSSSSRRAGGAGAGGPTTAGGSGGLAQQFGGGLILAGSPQFSLPGEVERYLRASPAPILRVNSPTYEAVSTIDGFTAKLTVEDASRTDAVVDHYSSHINIDRLLEAL